MLTRFLSLRVLPALVSVLSVTDAAHAQFSEGWEPGPATPGSAPIPAYWTSVNNSPGGPGTNPNWRIRNDGVMVPAFSGTTYAWTNFNASTGANDISNYLISPLVSFNNGDTISFYTRTVSSPQWPDRMELVYNTTGSTLPADFTHVLVTVNPNLTVVGYPNTWTQFTATITGLAGATAGRFAFHYNPTNAGPLGTTSDYIGVDAVVFSGTAVGFATNTTLGQGCGRSFASFYQDFATAASFNLGGTALSMVGSPYTVIPGLGTLQPVGATPTVLALTDDSEASYTFVNGFSAPGWGTGVMVCSNGFVSKASGNGMGYIPTPTQFLSGTQDWYAVGWHDFDPGIVGSGQVKVDETPSQLTITWDGVWDFGGTSAANASTMQMQVSSSGQVTYAYGTMSTLGAGFLVGYSPAGASDDPGSSTLLAATPFNLGTTDTLPLTLTASNRPVQMATPNNWNLVVGNIPATTVLGIDVFGLSDPNIQDLSLLGLGQAGCQFRASLDIVSAWVSTGATHNYSFTIPPTPSVNNFHLFTQSVGLGSIGPNLNLTLNITSNGIDGKIGNL